MAAAATVFSGTGHKRRHYFMFINIYERKTLGVCRAAVNPLDTPGQCRSALVPTETALRFHRYRGGTMAPTNRETKGQPTRFGRRRFLGGLGAGVAGTAGALTFGNVE